MTKATIITGTSYFNANTVVIGIAFPGDANGVAFTKWADKVGTTGRPSTVRSAGRFDLERDIARLTNDWLDWADREGVDLRIAKKARKNVGEF